MRLSRGRHRGSRKRSNNHLPAHKVVGWGPFPLPGERQAWERAAEHAEKMLNEVANAAERSLCKDWETHPVGCGCSHRKAKR